MITIDAEHGKVTRLVPPKPDTTSAHPPKGGADGVNGGRLWRLYCLYRMGE